MNRIGLFEAATEGVGKSINLPLSMKSYRPGKTRLYACVNLLRDPKGLEFLTPGWLSATEYGIWLCGVQITLKLLGK